MEAAQDHSSLHSGTEQLIMMMLMMIEILTFNKFKLKDDDAHSITSIIDVISQK